MREFVTPVEMTAQELKDLRKRLGITQKQFADLIGVSKPTVERWEVSKKPISGPVVLLSRFLTPEYVEDVSVSEKTLPLRMWYMYKNEPCTVIDVDERNEAVKIKNYTNRNQFRAFGVNENPDFKDYQEFLKSRCFPETRDKMKLILRSLDIPFYDPMMIIEKTEGRMAEDDFWIKIER